LLRAFCRSDISAAPRRDTALLWPVSDERARARCTLNRPGSRKPALFALSPFIAPERRRPSIAGRPVPARNSSVAESDQNSADRSQGRWSISIPYGKRSLREDCHKGHTAYERPMVEMANRPHKRSGSLPARQRRIPFPQQAKLLFASTSTNLPIARPSRCRLSQRG
jgi:hypothetical protein